MDIDLVFKIAATGIIVAVLNQLLIRSGREGQAIFWVAYDTMTQAANLLANDADAGNFAQTARDAAANYRRGFPTAEECFFNELMEGARYTITCGPARGIVTTVRPR